MFRTVDSAEAPLRPQDSAGRSSVREQHFTLEDGLTPSFGFAQSFILLTDHYILGRLAFVSMMLLNVGVLLAFRFLRVPPGRGERHTDNRLRSLERICRNIDEKTNPSFLHLVPLRSDLSGVHVAPYGQHNGHVLLLAAAVQPVHSLR